VRGSLLRAFGKVLAALAPNLLIRHLFVLIGIGTLGIVHAGDVRAPMAMAVVLGGTILSLAIASWSLRGARPGALAGAPIAEERALWLSATRFMLLMATTQLLLERTDVLLLGWFAGTTAVGIYSIGYRIAALVTFVLTAVNIIFAPAIAALYAQGDRSGLQGPGHHDGMVDYAIRACHRLAAPAARGICPPSFRGRLRRRIKRSAHPPRRPSGQRDGGLGGLHHDDDRP
jgi:O-antigen/teichoic acid export membrane protein